jgi:Domain of unknown function (DUF397)
MEGSSALSWRKSTYSGNNGGSCIETGSSPGAVLVRDTKQHGRGLVLRFTPDAWRELVAKIKNHA